MSELSIQNTAPESDGTSFLPCRDDRQIIAATVAQALSGCRKGWAAVVPEDLVLQDCSGFGGGRTYSIVRASEPEVPTVILHILPAFYCCARERPISFDRIRTAQRLFSQAGVSPARICEDPGGQWYLEEFGGDTLASALATTSLLQEVAALVARVHAIPVHWFDDIRLRMRRRYPGLSDVPVGSCVWWHVAKSIHFAEHVSAQELRALAEAGPFPVSPAGSRLVTSHGDVHRGNLVTVGGELRLIDLEFALVGCAVHDLCYATAMLCETSEQTNEFLRSYLSASGLPAGSRDVRALRLDVERCRMAMVFFDVNSPWAFDEAEQHFRIGDWASYLQYVAVADRALADADLADDMVSNGFSACAPAMAITNRLGKPCVDATVTVHDMLPEDESRAELTINWDGTLQANAVPWRGLVLGLNERDEVVLVPWSDRERALRLDLAAGRLPVTGIVAPRRISVPLLLSGRHAGQALVLAAASSKHFGNLVQSAELGDAASALRVHLEADGMVRLAAEPRQVFSCDNGSIEEGRRLRLYLAHGAEHQKFRFNADLAISPVGSTELVWGMRDDALCLVANDDTDRLTFDDSLVWGSPLIRPAGAAVEEPAAGHLLELASHPGKALSVGSTGVGSGSSRLEVVPLAYAKHFTIARRRLAVVDGGRVVAVGVAERVPDSRFHGRSLSD